METAETYRSIEGAEMFFEDKQQQLFQQLLATYPDRVISSDYLAEIDKQTLCLQINVGSLEPRRVCLKYDPTSEGEYLIAAIEATSPAVVAAPHLLLSMMRWQGRPIYTPTLSDEQRPVLGCSRRKNFLNDIDDLYDMTIGLADAMEQIEKALQNHSMFPYLWSNIPAAAVARNA